MPSSYPVIIIVSIVVIYFALKCKDDRKLNKVYIQKRAGRKGRASILTMTAVHITHHGNIKTQNERKKKQESVGASPGALSSRKSIRDFGILGEFYSCKGVKTIANTYNVPAVVVVTIITIHTYIYLTTKGRLASDMLQ